MKSNSTFIYFNIHGVSKTACNEDEDCGGDRICGDNGVGTGTACCQPFEGMKILYFMLFMSPQIT